MTDDTVQLTDDVVSTAVRDNELASFLSSAYSNGDGGPNEV